jgi:hypothetical protein
MGTTSLALFRIFTGIGDNCYPPDQSQASQAVPSFTMGQVPCSPCIIERAEDDDNKTAERRKVDADGILVIILV